MVLHLEVQYGTLVFGNVRLLPEVDMAGVVGIAPGGEGIAPEGEGNCYGILSGNLSRDAAVAEYVLSLLWLLRVGHLAFRRMNNGTLVMPDASRQGL